MKPSPTLLAVLRSGKPLPDALAEHGMSAEAFQSALAAYLRAKLPTLDGKRVGGVDGPVRIIRDKYSVPHIQAGDPHDLFFAYGYATAQDRLWQLDYLRRAAHGRLAEILGPEARASDIEVRTVGIGRLAHDLVRRLPGDTVECLIGFAEGINAVIEECANNLPAEFDVLLYACEPWRVADSLALMKHFWWQLTGRLFLIAGPELLRQHLQNDALYEAFLRSELQGESILPPGENRGQPIPALFELTGDDPTGSNNWAISPAKSASGHALFASDPHTPYGAPTIWYEAHLSGAGYDVAGMGYVGIPGIIFGRNRQGAWGITNNICSLRDLFVYAHGDPAIRNDPKPEQIGVRGAADMVMPLARTEVGPIVNAILPAGIREGRPVALRWVGAENSDEIGCLLRLNRTSSVTGFRSALEGWACPTFNFVWADRHGDIAYQCAGRLPRRITPGRGLRYANDPEDDWAGSIPFQCNPWCVNPAQGWIGTANNPVLPAGEDSGLGGMFTSDARARRIRTRMTSQGKFTLAECAAFQSDTISERVADVQKPLVGMLVSSSQVSLLGALGLLASWNGDMTADSGGAAIFEAFTRSWTRTVLAARDVPESIHDLVTRHIFGVAFELLKGDQVGWFPPGQRMAEILAAMREAVTDLTARLGPSLDQWRWGDLHTITLRHPLWKRGLLGDILNTGPKPIGGASHTINNQWANMAGSYEATAGANCRVAADLGTDELLICNCLGQSGHPASPHYRDQLDDWLAGRQHILSLDWAKVEAAATHRLEMEP